MTSKAKHLDSKTFDNFVKDGAAVVDFWAEWCGPCRIMGPIFEAASEEMKDKAKFGKVNVDENQELAERFQVMSIPTLIFFRDGRQVDRFSGVAEKSLIIKKIKESR